MFHTDLIGAYPQLCSKRAVTLLCYYFHIKEEHFKIF